MKVIKKANVKKMNRAQIEKFFASSKDNAAKHVQPQTIAPHAAISQDPPTVVVLDAEGDLQDKAGFDEPPSSTGFTYQYSDPESARPLIQKGTISGSINDSIQME